MEKCRRMKRQQFTSKNWISSWQWKFSKIRQQCYRLESFTRITDIHMCGPTVNNHVSLKTVFGYNVIRKTYVPIVFPAPSTTSSSSSSSGSTSPTSLPHESKGSAPIPASIECESADEQARSIPSSNPTKDPKPNKDVDHEQVRGDLSFSEIRGWLQEFKENLVEERVSEYRDSHASSFHEPSLELQQRTKITRAPCRRRTGEVVPRAKKIRWLDNSRSQSPWWRMWISEQSPICRCGARLGYSMDSIISV